MIITGFVATNVTDVKNLSIYDLERCAAFVNQHKSAFESQCIAEIQENVVHFQGLMYMCLFYLGQWDF